MNALELFNHRYSEDERFSWLEMIDFAEAYASQSKEECANYARYKAEAKQHKGYHMSDGDTSTTPKAVTDGEIAFENYSESSVDYYTPELSKVDKGCLEQLAYDSFQAGAKWREQQGEIDIDKIFIPGIDLNSDKPILLTPAQFKHILNGLLNQKK